MARFHPFSLPCFILAESALSANASSSFTNSIRRCTFSLLCWLSRRMEPCACCTWLGPWRAGRSSTRPPHSRAHSRTFASNSTWAPAACAKSVSRLKLLSLLDTSRFLAASSRLPREENSAVAAEERRCRIDTSARRSGLPLQVEGAEAKALLLSRSWEGLKPAGRGEMAQELSLSGRALVSRGELDISLLTPPEKRRKESSSRCELPRR
mmetsp:Transcript_298/g.595  ORF Transcript_298/g.595 Transcript_298/m.595 type:complete len:210 (-) Transcript_298:165-794(-)